MFIPITIDDYVEKHLAANPDDDPADFVEQLQFALAAARSGKRCACGNPIWVIGSSVVGLSCFTCITGEAVPSGDYEIADALEAKGGQRRVGTAGRRRSRRGRYAR